MLCEGRRMKPQIASSVAMMSVQSHWQIMADPLGTLGPYLITHFVEAKDDVWLLLIMSLSITHIHVCAVLYSFIYI